MRTIGAAPLARRIALVVRDQAGGPGTVPLHEPRLAGREWSYVKECLDTGWVSSAGAFVDRFETELAAYTGGLHAVATVNGTAALHVALQLAGVCAGDEVLVPALTFVATANAVSYCGAVPHFVDSDETSLGIDPVRLRAYLETIAEPEGAGCRNRSTGRRITAVVPMHVFGHPVDLDALASICDDFGVIMVEDAAESLGSFYRGRHTGTVGTLGVLSFNGNKILTTGGGGAIVTSDPDLAERARHLTTTGKRPHAWEYFHDVVAYNYRMPNINAALGCAQLEQLPAFVDAKRRLAERYAAAFEGVDGMRFVTEPKYARSNYWLNAVVLDEDLASARDEVLDVTNAEGIHTRPAWTLISRLPMYAGCPSMPLPTAESMERRLINLPSSAGLGRELS